MAQLSIVERRQLETLFDMGGGYVLDFSNRTFEEFVADSVGIEVYDDKYHYGSGSKANRLRGFWKLESNELVGKLIRDLVEYAEIVIKDIDTDLANACRAIADRLQAAPKTPASPPTRPIWAARRFNYPGCAVETGKECISARLKFSSPVPKGQLDESPGRRQGEFCEPCRSPGLRGHPGLFISALVGHRSPSGTSQLAFHHPTHSAFEGAPHNGLPGNRVRTTSQAS